ncbi:hypothetical protein HXX76_005753 [Chlamydomonas incerta]|uniref:Neurotransmitter-gated ion-channel transmembrane domain-containing protein n=1 Tax=Chlamydomonas incerta TaxID=51695 RepID=A0A835T3H0_CHLIN|nr:hypothetical protein HXX76_005753 [Chlamydomonas incerta]|eukprot:KAG2438144.1 hypothetical protein HXX76_005753 [Chlamydomonas incerta]
MKVTPVEEVGGQPSGGQSLKDPAQLPQADKEDPGPLSITLLVRTSIFAVSSIDTPGQSFTVTLYTRVYGRGLRPVLVAEGLDETFEPKLEWMEAELLEVTTRGWERLVRGDDLEWHFRARIKFAEQFELQRFPFDWQSLSMTLSCMYPAEWPNVEAQIRAGLPPDGRRHVQVHLQPVDAVNLADSSSCVSSAAGAGSGNPTEAIIFFRDGFLLRSIWSYRGHSVQHWLSHPSLSGQGKRYSNLQFSLHFSRVATYYTYNILLPLWLLTGLGFCAFSLDVAASTGDRLSLLVTLLLTAAAYKIVVSSALPLVSYLTRLDWYVLVAFGLLVALTVETAAVATVADEAVREKLDWALAAGLGGAWGLFSLGFVAMGWLGGRDPHTGLRILEEEARSRSSRMDYKVLTWAEPRD